MNVYKLFFNYQELIKLLKDNMNINSLDTAKKNLEIILATLSTNFVEPLKLKEKDNPDERFVNLVMDTGNFLDLAKGEIIIRKPVKYHIINEEIFEYMNKQSQNGIHILKDLKHNKLEYIINDGKIIIKFDSNNRNEILIAKYNLDNDKLEPEILFKYDSSELMAYHFEQLKKISYKIFKVKHTSLNGNELTLNNNDESNNKIF